MKTFTEEEAEKFLKKEGFNIVETIFVKKAGDLANALNKLDFPLVMKVSSRKIVHKTKVNGVVLNIKNEKDALKAFKKLKKINNAKGVLIQEQIKGVEYLIGLKKTKDFGFVVGFGKGGSKVEKMKKVDFRVCGVKGVQDLSQKKSVKKILSKICRLSEKYPKIDSLDVNPMIIAKKGRNKGKPVIVDAQIFFK